MEGGGLSLFPSGTQIIQSKWCGIFFVLFLVMRLRNLLFVNKELRGGREEMRDL